MQNRTIPIEVRTVLVLGMAHDMQGRINRQELFDCFSVMNKYKSKQAEEYVKEYCARIKEDTVFGHNTKEGIREKKTRFALAQELFDKLYELELLREDWDTLLLESQVLLYSNGEGVYMIRKYACTPMFTTALFTIAKIWKQPKCLLIDEWIKKM